MSDIKGLMAGKRGLIMGVANNRSIAWGIAKSCAAHGAELAFTFQGDALKKRVEPLAAEIGSRIVVPCDVTDAASMDAAFDTLAIRATFSAMNRPSEGVRHLVVSGFPLISDGVMALERAGALETEQEIVNKRKLVEAENYYIRENLKKKEELEGQIKGLESAKESALASAREAEEKADKAKAEAHEVVGKLADLNDRLSKGHEELREANSDRDEARRQAREERDKIAAERSALEEEKKAFAEKRERLISALG